MLKVGHAPPNRPSPSRQWLGVGPIGVWLRSLTQVTRKTVKSEVLSGSGHDAANKHPVLAFELSYLCQLQQNDEFQEVIEGNRRFLTAPNFPTMA